MSTTLAIPGYTYGTDAVERSPVTPEEFELLKQSALFDEDDIRYLRMSYDVLKDQVEDILDVWYGFIGSTPQLVATFTDSAGKPIEEYLKAVRKRFGQWILDTARGEYDQAWLDYQHEIGLRHHRAKKNRTDGVQGSPIVPFRYLFPVVYPVTFTLKPFLARGGHGPEEVEKMYNAWLKSCLLQMTLWARPYVGGEDF
jgi:hypothetical protein